MLEVNGCWCEADARESFSPHYDRCGACGTLISTRPIDPACYESADGEDSFYGRRYWEQYVPEVLGLPGLAQRARSDLSERDVEYLGRMLKYLAPGTRVLELGCAPGSLAFLMRQAGFEVTGVEMGAEVVDFVRRQFDLDVHPGPLELLDLRDTFDAVVMIDVLEHLPRPLQTLAACAERLAGEGALVIQTPCHRGEGAEWPMLLPDEHLFLYSERSVAALLERAGFQMIEASRGLFPHDMWVVASMGAPLQRRADPLDDVGPMALAALELYERTRVAEDHHHRIAGECDAKDDLIERLSRDLRAALDNGARNESALAGLVEEMEGLRSDQRKKSTLIDAADQELRTVRADQTAKQELIEALSLELDAARADQADKQTLISALSRELEQVRADQEAKQALIEHISEELAAVRADQREKEELIERISRELQETHGTGEGVVAHEAREEATRE